MLKQEKASFLRDKLHATHKEWKITLSRHIFHTRLTYVFLPCEGSDQPILNNTNKPDLCVQKQQNHSFDLRSNCLCKRVLYCEQNQSCAFQDCVTSFFSGWQSLCCRHLWPVCGLSKYVKTKCTVLKQSYFQAYCLCVHLSLHPSTHPSIHLPIWPDLCSIQTLH